MVVQEVEDGETRRNFLEQDETKFEPTITRHVSSRDNMSGTWTCTIHAQLAWRTDA